MFDEEYLFSNFLSTVTITEVRRVKRKMTINGETMLVPRRVVILTFEGNKVPDILIQYLTELNHITHIFESYMSVHHILKF